MSHLPSHGATALQQGRATTHVCARSGVLARAYEGSRYRAHYTAKMKCIGSGMLAKFEPRPNEAQHFNPPKSLGMEG